MEMTMTTMTKSRRHAAVKLPPQRNPTAQFQLPAISLILILISVYVSKYIILDCLTLFSDIISNLLVRRQHSSVQTKNQISNVSRPDKNGVFLFFSNDDDDLCAPSRSLCLSLAPSQDFTLFGRTCFSSQAAAQYCLLRLLHCILCGTLSNFMNEILLQLVFHYALHPLHFARSIATYVHSAILHCKLPPPAPD